MQPNHRPETIVNVLLLMRTTACCSGAVVRHACFAGPSWSSIRAPPSSPAAQSLKRFPAGPRTRSDTECAGPTAAPELAIVQSDGALRKQDSGPLATFLSHFLGISYFYIVHAHALHTACDAFHGVSYSRAGRGLRGRGDNPTPNVTKCQMRAQNRTAFFLNAEFS